MRLLDATTNHLVICDDNQLPTYAILSHTWGLPVDEVCFQDVQAATPASRADPSSLNWELKSGWVKIQRACAQALKHGYQYLWVDTCCIDKSSSAELQEGINSMFRWYESAAVCFAYLSDVASDCNPEARDSAFRKSRWFTRGWTLQELLAPQTVIFFDRDWNQLGDKVSFSVIIEEISGIEARYIGVDSYASHSFDESAYERLSEASVAQRMSWMSGRETTRREDMAYCLLGIFDIHMPMLYGEGDKAFARLQEEIMKASDDTTLLSWGYKFPGYGHIEADSILAPNPASFGNCHDLVPSELFGFPRPSFSMTQRGLVFSMPVKRDQNHERIIYAILACGHSRTLLAPGNRQHLLALPLVSASVCDSPYLWREEDEYLRYSWCTPMLVSAKFLEGAETRSLVIRRPSRLTERLKSLPVFLRPLRGCNLIERYPPQPADMFLGTPFVSLSTSSFLLSHIESRRTSRPGANPVPVKVSNEEWWNEEKGMRVFLIKTSAGVLLVMIDYEMKAKEGEKERLYVITCRAFEMPATEFNLELLYNLALSKETGCLRELPAINREEDTIFRVKKEDDVFLIIRIRRSVDRHMRTVTEVEMFTEWG